MRTSARVWRCRSFTDFSSPAYGLFTLIWKPGAHDEDDDAEADVRVFDAYDVFDVGAGFFGSRTLGRLPVPCFCCVTFDVGMARTLTLIDDAAEVDDVTLPDDVT